MATERWGLALLLCAIVAVLTAPAGWTHSLGVDRAELIETAPGSYRLTAKVPRRLAPAIVTPVFPERCAQVGPPSGERGSYAVSFQFTCEPPLTADDRLASVSTLARTARSGGRVTRRLVDHEHSPCACRTASFAAPREGKPPGARLQLATDSVQTSVRVESVPASHPV